MQLGFVLAQQTAQYKDMVYQFFLRRNEQIFTPGKALMTEKSSESAGFHFGELTRLLRSLTGVWVKVAYRDMSDSKAVALLKNPPQHGW